VTDRERILATLIDRLYFTQWCRGDRELQSQHSEYYLEDGKPLAHFAPWARAQPGELVLVSLETGSPWQIGWYVESLGEAPHVWTPGNVDSAVIQEIGSDRRFQLKNKGIVPIRGLPTAVGLKGDAVAPCSPQTDNTAQRTAAPSLTARERILITVIDRLCWTQSSLSHRELNARHSDFYIEHGESLVHFAPWDQPQRGDLVLLAGREEISSWKIAQYVEPLAEVGSAVIRDLGSELRCEVKEERFVPIRGLPATHLLEGEAWVLYTKIQKALSRAKLYHRFGGLQVEADQAMVRIRPYPTGLQRDAQPFAVSFTWSKRMSIAQILRALTAGGLPL